MPIRLFPWRRPRINVVEMHGLIAPRPGAVGMGTMAPLIDRAFRSARGRPVILDIESPGGSPVQSDLIAALVRRRADEQKLQVYAVIREVGASGGYWLACAADEIVADPASIVGSIGVVSAGFGFKDLIARFGIERRVHTSGDKKAMLDPFRDENPEDVERLKRLQGEIHDGFKDWVRERRGSKLKGDDSLLFSGEFWTARHGLEMGLVDSLGELRTVLQARYGDKVRLPVIATRRRLWQRFGFGSGIDGGLAAIGPSTLAALEERAHWQRFGL